MTAKEDELYAFVYNLKSRLLGEYDKDFDDWKKESNYVGKDTHEKQREKLEARINDPNLNPTLKERSKEMLKRNELMSDICTIINMRADNKIPKLEAQDEKYINQFFAEHKNIGKMTSAREQYNREYQKLDTLIDRHQARQQNKESRQLEREVNRPERQERPIRTTGGSKLGVISPDDTPSKIDQGDIKRFRYDMTRTIKITEDFSRRVTEGFNVGSSFSQEDLDYGCKMYTKNFSLMPLMAKDEKNIFDNIFVNGESINKMCKDNDPPLTPQEKMCLVSAYAMQRGNTVVDVMQPPDKNGNSKLVTLNPQMAEISYDGPKTKSERAWAVAGAFFTGKWGSIKGIVENYNAYAAQQKDELEYRENLRTLTKDPKIKQERHNQIIGEVKERAIERGEIGIEINGNKKSVDGFDKEGKEVKKAPPP
ncbi:MAG: hypothetical protein FWH10_04275, partial [Oscillospiraceae bacterium]|nr:hypothetical protein [Oscillospiraceae bacterium]